jgi:Protein of unknown function (DUF559)
VYWRNRFSEKEIPKDQENFAAPHRPQSAFCGQNYLAVRSTVTNSQNNIRSANITQMSFAARRCWWSRLTDGHTTQGKNMTLGATFFMKSLGYRVLRFTNEDVMKNLEGVVLTIAQALAATPSPNPSRKREGS